jgi:predicted PurR-regulated permease PerM
MELNNKDINKIAVLSLVFILGILVFFLIKPIILSILGGLILAYAFFPIYRQLSKVIKSKNLVATLVSISVIILILLPLYFLTPIVIKQVFDLFQLSQEFDTQSLVGFLSPSTAPESFINQIALALDSFVSRISAGVLNYLVEFVLEIPYIMFHLTIVAFVFFYTLRDFDKLSEFVSTLSPLNKIQEAKLVKKFKDITNSVVYGQIVFGLVQGILAGIGFYIFGIPGTLVLTILAIALSIIPIIGPFFVYIPAFIYLFSLGDPLPALIFLAYNLVLVSNVDNLLRLYFISKKINLSQVIVLIGMIGGLFIFGILGLIIGPLLLEYFLTFLDLFRKNELSSLFKT